MVPTQDFGRHVYPYAFAIAPGVLAQTFLVVGLWIIYNRACRFLGWYL